MDLCSLSDIRALLIKHDFNFSKAMGQNFLVDSSVPKRIVQMSGICKSDGVLEIGPGIGSLTQHLVPAAGKVVSVELDKRLLPILNETMNGNSNLDIINGDILKLDLNEIVENHFVGLNPIVCANLPYNITSPVLIKLVESKLFNQITVMVQREVAKRICALPGTPDYGTLSVYMQFYTKPSMLFDVPPSCFEPSPKVTSSVISLTLMEAPAADCNQELFFRIVRGAFNLRRKTLQNALSSAFSSYLSKEQIGSIIIEAGFAPNVRGESLGINEFAKLTKVFEKSVT